MPRINIVSVLVDDQEKALRCYTDVLGFQQKLDIPLGEARWLTVVSPEDPDGTELLLENGPGHRVLNNRVTNSSGDGINLRADNPVSGGPVLPAVTNAVVRGNTVAGNGKGAASIATPVAGIALRLNPTTGVGASGNRITGNRVTNNADHGIYVASRNNFITSNQARRNAVHDLHDANVTPPCDNNVWRVNAFGTFNQACVVG